MKQGICRPSKSNWASPLHMVKKPNGEWRPCGDYRRLNAKTIPDKYPIPQLHDFAHKLNRAKIFNTIDLTRAYHQIPVEPDEIPKTAIITPFGLFEFTSMQFGLSNAAQTFQRFMHSVKRDLDFCFVYLDDILIASQNDEEHKEHLNILFKQLAEYDFVININKCELGLAKVNFLGHTITPEGITPIMEKVKAITDFPLPKTAKGLRRFLGMLNYYRKFLPNSIETQTKLFDCMAGHKKNDKRLIPRNEELTEAFNKCKNQLANSTLLAHPDLINSRIAIKVDASDIAIGASLQQYRNGTWEPLGFFSRKFTPPQRKYSTFDRELTGVYEAVKYFRNNIEGRNFTIFTNHKRITFAFAKKRASSSPRQERQLDYIAQFSTDIKHISGRENIVADTLSRIEEINCPTIDYKEMGQAQNQDDDLFKAKDDSDLSLRQMIIPGTDTSLRCDISTGHVRPFVPMEMRNTVIQNVHNICHQGVAGTTNTIKQRFVWTNMKADIRKFVKHCIACQKAKISKHTVAPTATYLLPEDRFSNIHIDLVGPLPVCNEYQYLLTIIDRFTRWPEAIPLKDMSSETVTKALTTHWIARFGTPISITSDQGRQFESHLFRKLIEKFGIKHSRTTAYHPQANGIIERWHRTLKSSLMASGQQNWLETLPLILLGLRSTVRE